MFAVFGYVHRIHYPQKMFLFMAGFLCLRSLLCLYNGNLHQKVFTGSMDLTDNVIARYVNLFL